MDVDGTCAHTMTRISKVFPCDVTWTSFYQHAWVDQSWAIWFIVLFHISILLKKKLCEMHVICQWFIYVMIIEMSHMCEIYVITNAPCCVRLGWTCIAKMHYHFFPSCSNSITVIVSEKLLRVKDRNFFKDR